MIFGDVVWCRVFVFCCLLTYCLAGVAWTCAVMCALLCVVRLWYVLVSLAWLVVCIYVTEWVVMSCCVVLTVVTCFGFVWYCSVSRVVVYCVAVLWCVVVCCVCAMWYCVVLGRVVWSCPVLCGVVLFSVVVCGVVSCCVMLCGDVC